MKTKTKNTLYFLLILISFNACSKSVPKSSVNLKEFFFQLDNYETSKVLLYENKTNNVTSNLYFILNKSGNRLEITIINKDFIIENKLVDEYRENGIYLVSSSVYEDAVNKKIRKVSFEENLIFPLLDFTTEFGCISSSISASYPNYAIKSTEKHRLNKIVEMEQNREKVIQIISNGKIEQTYINTDNGEESYSSVDMTNTYTKGIGLTLSKQEIKGRETSIRYIRTISIDEFERIKAAANKI